MARATRASGVKPLARHSMLGGILLALWTVGVFGGGSGARLRAAEPPEIQVVLALDLGQAGREARLRCQAAALLAVLLGDTDYLGLVAGGRANRVTLPAARLTPAGRAQIVTGLNKLAPEADAIPTPENLLQALEAFDLRGPPSRFLLLIQGAAANPATQKDQATSPETELFREVSQRARQKGVAVSVAFLSSAGNADALKALSAATGGWFLEVGNFLDLAGAVLNFYERLKQPQEAVLAEDRVLFDPWVRAAVLVAARADPRKAAVLTDPSGRRLTPGARLPHFRWIATPAYDLVMLSQPQPGAWKLSQVRLKESRVFLNTDLRLISPHPPRDLGADEVLVASALLVTGRDQPLSPELLATANCTATLLLSPQPPATVELKAEILNGVSPWPAGTRVGRFPPLGRQGEGTLWLTAQGKNWARQVSYPLWVGPPWYGVTVIGGPDKFWWRFQLEPGRRFQRLGGAATLRSPQGALVGALVAPDPGKALLVARPAGSPGGYLASLNLEGAAAGGRPLVIASAPGQPSAMTVPNQAAALAPTEAPPPPEAATSPVPPPSLAQKLRRRGPWLGMIIGGIVVLALAAALLIHLFLREAAEPGDEGAASPREKGLLLLQAQVDALSKEKAQLQLSLAEMSRQVDVLQAEKADLEVELAKVSEKSLSNLKSLEELEKKLEETEKEARAVQEEYMALYARSQEARQELKKE